ncbi:MAG: 50S ribosomal protein L22 [Candidatus Pacebacteria bacterium GW2011_GWF2_38_9]|nr:MAG: 50S ribosomal protein L22, large subunit ribosomal protein L22 [candidate division TM6 bacterium GW2011_GWF2_28_16]KKQ08244.1 MAG: 50S ribosomal protein L22 [Candidatus Pacebacteria bacterium GW2011_GWF1_36_5]KKQ88562.1 MAG: 50S ribosomal protein L22 [Candidatus Pacebacteria bacterium GW2011_GWF2_38_9]HAZ73531.1 50S ribosomal protein L22 [Candidatus Paceibacterota bacterium]
MIIKAEQRNTRQTSRKVRLVADVVKKMSIVDAINQLAVMNRKSSLLVLKVLRQATANATNNFNLVLSDLEIDNIVINDGPALKRWRAVSRGRAHTILKRTCHVRVDLRTKKEVEPTKIVKKEVTKKVEEVKKESEVKEVKKTTVKKAQDAIKLDRSKSQAANLQGSGKGQANKLIQSQKKGSK